MSTSSSKRFVRRGLVFGVGLLAIVALMASRGSGDDAKQSEPVEVLKDEVKPDVPVAVVRQDKQEHIEAVLKDPTQVQFDGTPLNEVMSYLADVHHFTVMLDKNALEEIPIATDVPITISLSDIKLASTLNLILEPLQLTYIIEDEVLKITTVNRANERMEVRIYDTRGLEGSGYTSELLTEVIRTSIPRARWKQSKDDEEGGTVVSLSDGLVVTQSQPVHREIAKVLQMLEQHAKGRTPSNPTGNAQTSVAPYTP